MIMPAAECNAMNGAQPWVDPPSSGVPQLPANAAQCRIATATDTHNRNAKGWNTWIKLSTKLKQQTLGAADKAHLAKLMIQVVGHAARTAGNLLLPDQV
jgi:hypothetical protein